jgi:hypothetical protein
MRDLISEAASQLWLLAHRLAGYALVNLLDDPAILAMAFC